jgi:uncharacterized protein (DUF2141 family)
MNPRRLAAVSLLLAGIGCATRTAPTPAVPGPEVSGTARLTIRLLGLESDNGAVAVALYDSADSFENRSGAIATGRIRPREGIATWTVEALEPGVYAVAAYHDLDGSGQLERSTLGAPIEPYGFSNDARRAFGPPKFDKAAIGIGPGDLIIEITLR